MTTHSGQIDIDVLRSVIEQRVPFNRYLGIEVLSLGDGRMSALLPFRPEFVGDATRPALHGGVISALLDAAGGAALFTRIQPDDKISTIDLLVDFLRPCPLRDLVAHSAVVRVGGRVALVELKAHPDGDEAHVVATGRATYNIKRASR